MSKVEPEDVDDHVEQDTEDNDGEDTVETFTPDRGPDREEMVAGYLPGEEDWDAKTQLDIDDPHNVALIRNYEAVMPEMSHWQGTLDEFTDDFLKSQTSVGGASRSDFRSILMGMFGADDSEDNAMNQFAKALGVEDDDD